MGIIYLNAKEFERDHNVRCTPKHIKAVYPQYVAFCRVVDGYFLFSTLSDYDLWKRQK